MIDYEFKSRKKKSNETKFYTRSCSTARGTVIRQIHLSECRNRKKNHHHRHQFTLYLPTLPRTRTTHSPNVYLEFDLIWIQHSDGRMCSHECSRRLVIWICQFYRFHIRQAPVFGIVCVAMAEHLTLIHVKQLFRLQLANKRDKLDQRVDTLLHLSIQFSCTSHTQTCHVIDGWSRSICFEYLLVFLTEAECRCGWFRWNHNFFVTYTTRCMRSRKKNFQNNAQPINVVSINVDSVARGCFHAFLSLSDAVIYYWIK